MASSSELAVSRGSGARKASAILGVVARRSPRLAAPRPGLSAYSLPISSVSSRANSSARSRKDRRGTPTHGRALVERFLAPRLELFCACATAPYLLVVSRQSGHYVVVVRFTVRYAMVLLPFSSRLRGSSPRLGRCRPAAASDPAWSCRCQSHLQTAHSRCGRVVRERTDIASDPAHRAGGVVKASLASSFGRQVVAEISSCTN